METNTQQTVCLSDTKLFTIDNFLTEDQCDALLEFIVSSDSNFINRAKHSVNLGLDGSAGKYESMLVCRENFPVQWETFFCNRSINGIPLDSVMVNKYNTGDYIPKHKDKQGSIFTVCVPLQTSQDSLIFIQSRIPGDQEIVCKDVKGTGYGFFGNNVVHYVPPVQEKVRYSLVCLYGPDTY